MRRMSGPKLVRICWCVTHDERRDCRVRDLLTKQTSKISMNSEEYGKPLTNSFKCATIMVYERCCRVSPTRPICGIDEVGISSHWGQGNGRIQERRISSPCREADKYCPGEDSRAL